MARPFGKAGFHSTVTQVERRITIKRSPPNHQQLRHIGRQMIANKPSHQDDNTIWQFVVVVRKFAYTEGRPVQGELVVWGFGIRCRRVKRS
jgi:hypothetical protein